MARPNRTRLDAMMEIYARMNAEERNAARYVMMGYDLAQRSKAEEPKETEQAGLLELGERMTTDGR